MLVFKINRGKVATVLTTLLLTFLLMLTAIAPSSALAARWRKPATEPVKPEKLAGKLIEVAPPDAIQSLKQTLDRYKPQVLISNPKPNQVLEDDRVSVQFQVKDLPIFKDNALGLGTHLHVLLDNQTYQAVYDTSKPLVFEDLQPGTHTIRAFASRPWHESFKNEGAFAQTTFHIFTKTQENSPNSDLPLLTYSRPQGTYGAEPIMVDFYLTNAPLHLIARESKKDAIADWRVRCTVNGKSFILDQWQPIYLKGFKPGKNWVQLEFLDENSNLVKNTFNDTARIITYEPGGKDTLSKLVRGDILAADAQGIVDPNYKPPTPAPSPVVEPAPLVKPTPIPVQPVIPQDEPPKKLVSPSLTPAPIAPPATPKVQATPLPIPTKKQIEKELKEPIQEPPAESTLKPRLKLKTPTSQNSTPTTPSMPEQKSVVEKLPQPEQAFKESFDSAVEPDETVAPRITLEQPVTLKVDEPISSTETEIETETEKLRSPSPMGDAVEPKDVRSEISEKTAKFRSNFASQFNQVRQRLQRKEIDKVEN
jgi:hypothetical protein